MEVAAQFRAQGTPMGYRIDAAGRIASQVGVGGEALLKLAAAPELALLKPAAKTKDIAAHHREPDPSLARSKINRNGLKAGAIAPDFRLPQIDGGEQSLADFRGQRVLLVFSDPNCGPCDELAPGLQQIHAERSDLRVLMISRCDLEATCAKAVSLGLSFPIVMQKQWEISLLYGKFATPIAYFIDEQSVLLSDVVVGIEPILALAEQRVVEDARSLALTSWVCVSFRIRFSRSLRLLGAAIAGAVLSPLGLSAAGTDPCRGPLELKEILRIGQPTACGLATSA